MQTSLNDDRTVPVVDPSPLLTLIVVIAAVGNLFVPSAFRGPGPSFQVAIIFFSGLASQPALLAIWTVFGIEPVAKRISRVGVIFLLGWFSWMLGLALASNGVRAGEAIVVALVAIFLQILLVVVVGIYRWRTRQILCHGDYHPNPAAPVQFSVKQIFVWTTTVAVALVLFRAMFGGNASVGSMRGLAPVLGMGLLFALDIALITISTLELCLGQRAKVLWFTFLCASQVLFPIAVFAAIGAFTTRRASGDDSAEFFGGCLLFSGSMSAVLFCVLTLIRSVGFRLVPRRNDQIPMTNDQ